VDFLFMDGCDFLFMDGFDFFSRGLSFHGRV
jgi:hypothetical protein